MVRQPQINGLKKLGPNGNNPPPHKRRVRGGKEARTILSPIPTRPPVAAHEHKGVENKGLVSQD